MTDSERIKEFKTRFIELSDNERHKFCITAFPELLLLAECQAAEIERLKSQLKINRHPLPKFSAAEEIDAYTRRIKDDFYPPDHIRW